MSVRRPLGRHDPASVSPSPAKTIRRTCWRVYPVASQTSFCSHDGSEHVIAPNGREMFRAFFTQSPFAGTDRSVGLYVEVGDLTGRLTPDEVERFADDVTAAEQVRGLGRQLAVILAGGAR